MDGTLARLLVHLWLQHCLRLDAYKIIRLQSLNGWLSPHNNP